MIVTGADMLAEVVAVEGCGPDLAVNAVQHYVHSMHVCDRSRHASTIELMLRAVAYILL